MMKTRLLLAMCLILLYVGAAPAMADMSSLQSVLDNITISPNYHDSSVDVTTDMLPDDKGAGPYDSYWSVTASGGSWSTIIVELCTGLTPDKQTFGVFDYADSTNYVELFAGSAGAGDQATLSIKADGSVWVNLSDSGKDFAANLFGFYFDTTAYGAGSLRVYSDTALNSDGVDHMYAYQGKDIDTVQLPGLARGVWTDNEFVLAWEGKYDGYAMNYDYEDFVVMVESVTPIPVPGAVLLGLLGLTAAGVKLRRFA